MREIQKMSSESNENYKIIIEDIYNNKNITNKQCGQLLSDYKFSDVYVRKKRKQRIVT